MSEAPFLFCVRFIEVKQHSAQTLCVLIILARYKIVKFSPSISTAEIAQLGERQTEDLKVPGSNPENSYEFWTIPGLGREFFFPSSYLQIYFFPLKLYFLFTNQYESLDINIFCSFNQI